MLLAMAVQLYSPNDKLTVFSEEPYTFELVVVAFLKKKGKSTILVGTQKNKNFFRTIREKK